MKLRTSTCPRSSSRSLKSRALLCSVQTFVQRQRTVATDCTPPWSCLCHAVPSRKTMCHVHRVCGAPTARSWICRCHYSDTFLDPHVCKGMSGFVLSVHSEASFCLVDLTSLFMTTPNRTCLRIGRITHCWCSNGRCQDQQHLGIDPPYWRLP
jgi:hypothetical protein